MGWGKPAPFSNITYCREMSTETNTIISTLYFHLIFLESRFLINIIFSTPGHIPVLKPHSVSIFNLSLKLSSIKTNIQTCHCSPKPILQKYLCLICFECRLSTPAESKDFYREDVCLVDNKSF